ARGDGQWRGDSRAIASRSHARSSRSSERRLLGQVESRASAATGADAAASDAGVRRRGASRGALALKGVLMSARIFFAGAVVGAIVGALAVVALQKEGASTPVAENSTTATVREETTSRSDASPAQAPVNVVQSAADPSVPAAARSGSTANVATTPSDPGLPAPGSTADVAPPSSSDPGDEVIRTDAEMRARGESMEQLGDKMKSEARDDAWAPNMENELRDFLARRPVP